MYRVQDWAEVHQLHRAGIPAAAIARRLSMSRTTVRRLVALREPPAYEREARSSLLDPFTEQIAAMLDTDAKVAATVVIDHLRREGYAGGITILKEHLAKVRPAFIAARSFQRTSYLPGEIGQIDWWVTGVDVPVGKGATRPTSSLVTTLPASAAHEATFTLSRTVPDLLHAALRCFERLGGVPEKIVCDNDSSIVATRAGGRAILHDEVAGFFGALGAKVIVLRPGDPQSKGQVERTNGYLDTSFLPLRTFTCVADMQDQHDDWNASVARRRHHRRVGAIVSDALRVETTFLRPLPEPHPDTDRHLEARVSRDCFVRVGDVDYSVPPGLMGRRVQLRTSATEVVITLEGHQLARHVRSFVPADVVLAEAHAKALRDAREAKARLRRDEADLETIDLSRYDALAGAAV